jgi:hypothetical protein
LNVALASATGTASGHKRKAAMDVNAIRGGGGSPPLSTLSLSPLCLLRCRPRVYSLCEVVFVRESEVAKHCIPGRHFFPLHKLHVVFKDHQLPTNYQLASCSAPPQRPLLCANCFFEHDLM